MNEADFQTKLGDLIQQLGGLTPEKKEALAKLADETTERHAKMKKTVSDLQESLDYLRLSIKYVLFDLEATRRENQYLRRLLERHAGSGETGSDEEQRD
jgi:chromosome segregation ATPase